MEKHEADATWQQKKREAEIKNSWFTQDNITKSINAWIAALEIDSEIWLSKYPLPARFSSQTLGIIMAGNIPFVGLHDLLCGIMCGRRVRIKPSSDDEVLMNYLVKGWVSDNPELADRIEFSDNFKGLDAAIATGSNNSGRYFEYYFRQIPHLLRGHRNSVAVVAQETTEAELTALGEDIFTYFGRGCRNVTHLLLPRNFDMVRLFHAWEPYAGLIHHHKYANNYHYHRAILLMNLNKHLDNGFLILKETNDVYAPVGMVGYHFYDTLEDVSQYIGQNEPRIQVVTGVQSNVNFGKAQHPGLADYADHTDTMTWLLENYKAEASS
ncbi:MAG: acyl-CoA reductase [Bacteroidetes bacterium]|nr:acyl-CoA reductase [Bacteroidota bacterium]